jgi:hypothetical protein
VGRGTRARRSRLPPAHASLPFTGSREAVTDSDAPSSSPQPVGASDALMRGRKSRAGLGPRRALPRPGVCLGQWALPVPSGRGECTGRARRVNRPGEPARVQVIQGKREVINPPAYITRRRTGCGPGCAAQSQPQMTRTRESNGYCRNLHEAKCKPMKSRNVNRGGNAEVHLAGWMARCQAYFNLSRHAE